MTDKAPNEASERSFAESSDRAADKAAAFSAPTAPPHSSHEGRSSTPKGDSNASASAQSQTSGTSRDGNTVRQAADFWYDKQHKDLLFYLSIGIVFLEMVVGAVAFFYGVIHATPAQNGLPPRFQFPWLAYSIAAVVAPAVLLLIVHLAGVGLFRSLRDTSEEDEAWRQDLPERLRKVYAIVQGAPTILLLVGVMVLGAALFYIDGAMTALFRLGSTVEVYLPWIIGAVAGAWCLAYAARIWLNYRTKRLEEEYRFRREVLERTGVIIVDRGSMQLPPAALAMDPSRALEGGGKMALGEGGQNISGAQTATNTDSHGPIVDVDSIQGDSREGKNPL